MILLWAQPGIIAEKYTEGFTHIIKSVHGQHSPVSGQAMIFAEHFLRGIV